ncbi:hypothetical protein ARMA_1897 [Ardenticatena maritima]|uniref:Peptidase M16 n=1 Tax=Ardenticatena maritima TaxID=872965 RepID=A0A0M9UCZ9_9CHLR|nr:pitrilysin family protein [Ardenticatena maritima]GAP63474.1 hypothetical protein ARMA_1897 [Ardenticatena maritima]
MPKTTQTSSSTTFTTYQDEWVGHVVYHSRLPNGLHVVSVPLPDRLSVMAVLSLRVGSRYEDDRQAGVAHLIEHLVFKGTHTRPTSRDVVLPIEGVGGILNANTSREMTNYWGQVPFQHVERLLDVLFDMVMNPLMREEDVEHEKAIIIEEINASLDMPDEVAGLAAMALLHPGHPLGRDIAGTRETVRALTREDVLAFMQTFYGPQNGVLAVAGRVEHEDVVAWAQALSAEWQGGAGKQPFPAQPLPAGLHVQCIHRDIEQVQLVMGVRTVPERHPDQYPLLLLNALLGDGMASRLFLQVREQLGLAYHIGSYLSFGSDFGEMTIEAGVDPANVMLALEAIASEVRNIVAEGPTPEEVIFAREYVTGRLLLGLESGMRAAGWYVTQLLQGVSPLLSPSDVLAALAAVQAEDIQRVAQTYLTPSNMVLVLVGPVGDAPQLSPPLLEERLMTWLA